MVMWRDPWLTLVGTIPILLAIQQRCGPIKKKWPLGVGGHPPTLKSVKPNVRDGLPHKNTTICGMGGEPCDLHRQ